MTILHNAQLLQDATTSALDVAPDALNIAVHLTTTDPFSNEKWARLEVSMDNAVTWVAYRDLPLTSQGQIYQYLENLVCTNIRVKAINNDFTLLTVRVIAK